MPKLHVLCGLPASGKSTYAHTINKNAVILSSDNIRKELFNDIKYQGANNIVFQTLYDRANTYLSEGTDVIIDATNTTIKSRRKIFENIKIKCKKYCYIFATTYYNCVERDKHRDKRVGEDVINKFLKSFQIPFIEEGWDDIHIIKDESRFYANFNLEYYLARIANFNQNNPYHTESLLIHSIKVFEKITKIMPNNYSLIIASLLHDFGKIFTQTVDSNGIAHYYNHANVGTYKLLSEYNHLTNYSIKNIKLDILFYINYHMRETKKYDKIFGNDKVKNLDILYNTDKERQNEYIDS